LLARRHLLTSQDFFHMTHRLALLATFVAASAGCEKTSASTTPPAEDSAGAAAEGGAADGGATADTEPGAPGVAWKDKTFDQKKEFMGVEVFPKMKAMFKAYDAGQFGSFKCDTCHGPDPKARNYEMPTDAMYPLPADNPVKAAMDYDEKVTRFMIDEVMPDMAQLLELQSGDPATGLGEFGCLSCHPTE
jgi:hypothetical protein